MTFMLMVFSVTFLVIQNKTGEVRFSQTENQVVALAKVINSEIDLARKVHGGYKKYFWLPEYINGEEYTVQIIDNQELTIRYRDKRFYSFLDINGTNVTGNINKGYNTIVKNYSSIVIYPGKI